MKRLFLTQVVAGAVAGTCLLAAVVSAEPALTIYNQNFAVVRDTISLDLQRGVNQVRVSDVTSGLEPDSVVLRDPSGKRALQILEQNYRADPITVQRLLALNEGKTIDFLVRSEGKSEIVRGKLIRSGNVVPVLNPPYFFSNDNTSQPLVEVDGKLRFQLPGIPLFPDLSSEAKVFRRFVGARSPRRM
ncbi:MAG TPA: hypothetical protein VF600_11790 [Abditibacteriaceae bacterium]